MVYAPVAHAVRDHRHSGRGPVGRGLEVLLHQAVAQVELMTGRPGPVAEMRTALEAAVAARV